MRYSDDLQAVAVLRTGHDIKISPTLQDLNLITPHIPYMMYARSHHSSLFPEHAASWLLWHDCTKLKGCYATSNIVNAVCFTMCHAKQQSLR